MNVLGGAVVKTLIGLGCIAGVVKAEAFLENKCDMKINDSLVRGLAVGMFMAAGTLPIKSTEKNVPYKK